MKRAQDGEAADVVITLGQGLDTLVKDGKAPAGDVTVLARSGIVVVGPQGCTQARHLVARTP